MGSTFGRDLPRVVSTRTLIRRSRRWRWASERLRLAGVALLGVLATTSAVVLGAAAMAGAGAAIARPAAASPPTGSGDAAALPVATIRSLQHSLMQGGYDVDSTDGVWGPKTEAAVRAFQKVRGLAPTGRPDERTLAALGVDGAGHAADAAPTGGAGASARQATGAPRSPADLGRETIVAIQRALREQGFEAGPVDGAWGERTESAIADLQRAHGMAASGELDPRTLTVLKLLPGRTQADADAGRAPADPGLDPAAIRLVQQALGRAGEKVVVDGAWGGQTVERLRAFQREQGLPADGAPDVHTLAALGLLPGSRGARSAR
ncbi:MAG: peptidoglycan-binding protein [Lautropia sp.]